MIARATILLLLISPLVEYATVPRMPDWYYEAINNNNVNRLEYYGAACGDCLVDVEPIRNVLQKVFTKHNVMPVRLDPEQFQVTKAAYLEFTINCQELDLMGKPLYRFFLVMHFGRSNPKPMIHYTLDYGVTQLNVEKPEYLRNFKYALEGAVIDYVRANR